ncbi:GntR family transcriptional regulator [Desulfotignum balticum]|uniref:GntR family transcriptional regulator n=1 Tax=Desulfotignum balticum TaxID=115781 RepID=UPI000462A873|nr:GntR family transcriptional regulator [Desulfotignum balticum]
MTIAEKITKTLRQEILNNTLSQGEPLSENVLGKRFKTSRTPVREAIRRLENDRLVQIIQGRGAIVSMMDISQLSHVFEVRIVLEPLAAESSFVFLRQPEITKLEEQWLALEDRLHSQEIEIIQDISDLDRKTHRFFTHKTPNPWLRTFLSTLEIQVARMQNMAASGLGEATESIRQHLELVSLLKSGDREAFIVALRNHIIISKSYVASNIDLNR